MVGVVDIVSKAYPDPTQFDPASDHYDPKSTPENPRWLLVDVRYRRKLDKPVTLAMLKANAAQLAGLAVLAPGSRLSVTPVSKAHWDAILAM